MGGIFDHVDGGIARYTVDNRWLVPHFEKMLYDNALYIELLAMQSNNVFYKHYFKHKIDCTLVWLTNVMKYESSNNCCFYSAIDADSDGVEGKYYVWDYEEIKQILGDEADYFMGEYNISKNCNWEDKNILNRLEKNHQNEILNEYSKRNIQLLKKIKSIRNTRIPPQIDIKILTDWNLMLCSALIRAYRSYDDGNYYKIANQILDHFENKIEKHKTLFHSYCNNKPGHTAFIGDYANLIKVYIGFYLCNFDKYFLNKAVDYTEHVIINFYDPKRGSFYYSSINKKIFIILQVSLTQQPQSGAGIMFENLMGLHCFTNNKKYLEIVGRGIKLAWPSVYKNPVSLSSFVHAANLIINSHHVVVIKNKNEKNNEVESYLRQHLIFNAFVFISNSSSLPNDSPAYGKKTVNNKTTVYICSKSACYEPINDIEKLKRKLKELPFY